MANLGNGRTRNVKFNAKVDIKMQMLRVNKPLVALPGASSFANI